MKKRGNFGIEKYISENIKRGHSKSNLKVHLLNCGFDETYIDKELNRREVRKNSVIAASIILVLLLLFLIRPSITGFISSSDSGQSFEGLTYSSADYSPDASLIYQGLSQDNTEKIIGASVQGKQKGSLNIIDYNNDGKADLFTTGFYTSNNEQVASTNLYKDLSQNTGSFENVKNSDSCWADFDNDGWIEPAIIGEGSDGLKLITYKNNKDGTFSVKNSFEGFSDGSIQCNDYDNDGWADIVVAGYSLNGERLLFYKNNDGDFSSPQSIGEMSYCRITSNDFNNDGKLDFIISGSSKNNFATYLFTGPSFSQTQVISEPISNPSVSSGDYNNDGQSDFAISGNNGPNVNTMLMQNQNGNFQQDPTSLTPLRLGKILMFNQNDNIAIFNTGEKKETTYTKHAELIYLLPETQNSPPSIPSSLNYSVLENNYLKLTWQPSTDDHTKYLFYQVRAGSNENPNKYLSGFLSDEKGNAQLNTFKLLTDPKECFFFQVKAIDAAYKSSEWSDKFEINCEINQTINLTLTCTDGTNYSVCSNQKPLFCDNGSLISKCTACGCPNGLICNPSQQCEVNTTQPIDLIQNITEESSIWYHDRTFDNLRYHAQYERLTNYVLVTETVTNEDLFAHDNVEIIHKRRFQVQEAELDKTDQAMMSFLDIEDRMKFGGFYSLKDPEEIKAYLGLIKPGEKRIISVKLQKDIRSNNVMPTQINSNKYIPQKPIITETINITDEIRIEENKTIIPINITVNELILAEEGVCVDVHIPECLKETINELSIKSNREFSIIGDSIVRFCFDNIIEKQSFEFAIDSVADENCTNMVRVEKTAKNVLMQKDKLKPMNAVVLLVTALLLTIPIYLFVNNAKKKQRNFALLLFAAFFILLNIFDTLSMLPESLDFLKKLFSWVLILALLYHVSLKNILFSGDGSKNKFSFLNILILLAFVSLSIKNIIYVAFKTYAKEQWFSDLLLPIIKYSPILAKLSLFMGASLILLLTLWVIKKVILASPSFASLLHKTEYNFIAAPWKKPLYVLLVFIGFYMAFFNFLFGWFSIAFDGPFLILTLILVVYSIFKTKKSVRIKDIPDKTDTLIERFMELFTHDKNVFIAFSAFPVLIFIVELYNYLVYMLFGIKNIYFEQIEAITPTISQILVHQSLIPLYILQFLGFVSAMMLAFLFWWHFFMKISSKNSFIADKPKHPFLFAVLLTSFISYLVRPIFRISLIQEENLGILISLKESISSSYLSIIYLVLSLLFVLSYLIFRDSKKTNVIPYSITLFTVAYINIAFITSIVNRIDFRHILDPSSGFITLFNSVFSLFALGIYIAVLLFSLYSLVGEFLHLFKEEFGDIILYRKLMLLLFSHKIAITEQQKHQIDNYMEKMLDQGEEEYLVIEQIHEKTHLPLRVISKILKELEDDDEQKQKYHTINHYHHNLPEIKKLYKMIKQQYYTAGLDAESIIDYCLEQGWSQEDIAAAMMHLKYKKQDKILFETMRKVSL